MRLLCLIAGFCFGALGQPGAPIFTNIGPLSCGMRLWTPGQVQKYCYYNSPPKPLKVVCNSIDTITPLVPSDSPPVASSQSCFASAVAGVLPAVPGLPTIPIMPCAIYEVTWIVWQPVVALPPGSTGTIVYQVASTQQSGVVNKDGQCAAQNGGPPPTTTMQQGSFSSGVLVAGIQAWQTDGEAPVLVDTEPGPQWTASYGSGLTVLSNDSMAQASWLGGFCRVVTASPGIAQFVISENDGVKVGWLPDGWCADRVELAAAVQPTLAGQCSPLTLSSRFLSVDRCSAAPGETVQQLVNAHLGFSVQSPVVQGQ